MSKPPVRAALAALIAYQAVMYGFVMRAYLHTSLVLAPWLLTQPDYTLYRTVKVWYPPGYLWFHAGMTALMPDPVLRMRLGHILMAIVVTLLLYKLATDWWGARAGLIAAASFALWGPLMSQYLMYYEVALGLLALLALTVWHRHDQGGWRPLAAGVIIGLALLVKHHALAIAGAYMVWRLLDRNWRSALLDVARFAAGFALPIFAVVLILASQGSLTDALYQLTGFTALSSLQNEAQIGIEEIGLLVLLFALVPLFAIYTLWKRERWSSQWMLLLGLLLALLTPVVPLYGRFRLAAALPVLALISAGTVVCVLQHWRLKAIRVYATAIVAITMPITFGLPIYYLARLGPLQGQIDEARPIANWVIEQTGAPIGTRILIQPDIEQTANFYVLSGYLPATVWVPNYEWSFRNEQEHLMDQLLAGVAADPPEYVVLVDSYRNQVLPPLWEYIEANYALTDEGQLGNIGRVFLYEYQP